MNFKRLLEEKLREAASLGDVKNVKELILKGVDVNSKNRMNGWTALHWAACRGYMEIVSILLQNGADKASLNYKNETPYHVSTSKEIQLFLEGKTLDKQQQLPITPNYLRNPPLCSSYNECDVMCQESIRGEEDLLLKIREAGPLSNDFIEIEVPVKELNFKKLKEICIQELGILPDEIIKIRKLPNTLVRNDKDVQRLKNFQELEVIK